VAEVADDRLDIHRDDRLVLDDEDVGERLPFDLLERFGDERVDVLRAGADKIAGVFRRKALKRGQQQRLARQGSDPRQARVSDALRTGNALGRFLAFLDVGRRPEGVEGLVQTEPGIDVARKLVRLGDDRLKCCPNKCIPMRLAAGQGSRVAAEEWQMRSEFLA
jgi:hypothetical protein